MKKMLVLFVLVMMGLPIIAEAQSRTGGWVGRGTYRLYSARQSQYGGYYDPVYLEQMLKLPESLLACQMNFGDKTVEKCHTLLKSVNYMEGHAVRHEDLNEIEGTFRIYKKGQYFCPFDDTDHRIGRGGATAIGTGAGTVAGSVFGGRKGAVIGAGAGAFAGWWAARKSNNVDKCLEIIGKPQAAESEQETSPVSYVEQGVQPTVTSPSASVTWPTVNTTDFRAVVTDPNTGQERLIPAGGSTGLPEPAGEQPYIVVLLAPGRGSIDRVSGEIRPSQDLQGWDIVARQQ